MKKTEKNHCTFEVFEDDTVPHNIKHIVVLPLLKKDLEANMGVKFILNQEVVSSGLLVRKCLWVNMAHISACCILLKAPCIFPLNE